MIRTNLTLIFLSLIVGGVLANLFKQFITYQYTPGFYLRLIFGAAHNYLFEIEEVVNQVTNRNFIQVGRSIFFDFFRLTIEQLLYTFTKPSSNWPCGVAWMLFYIFSGGWKLMVIHEKTIMFVKLNESLVNLKLITQKLMLNKEQILNYWRKILKAVLEMVYYLVMPALILFEAHYSNQ